MITVHLRYEIDPDKLEDFTEYGRTWIRLVAKHGGTHHGYFLPSEGDCRSSVRPGGRPPTVHNLVELRNGPPSQLHVAK